MRTSEPPWVPKRLGPKHLMAARMCALGRSRGEIAQALKLYPTTVSHWRRSPEFVLAVEEFQRQITTAMIEVAVRPIRERRGGPGPGPARDPV